MPQNKKGKIIQLLRWSEKYTKTDMVYLAHGSFWTWFGKGIQMLAGIAMAIAFANLLPREIYGNYKYILSVAGILSGVTLAGMNTAIRQAVARGFEGVLLQGVITKLRWSIPMFLLAVGASVYYFLQGNTLLGSGMAIVALFQPIIKTAELYHAHLQGKQLFKIDGIYLAVWEIVQAVLIISALFVTNNAVTLIALLFGLNALFVGFYLYQTLHRYVQNTRTDNQTISYAKHLSLMRAISKGSNHLDKVLIFQFLGATPTAIYAFALLPTEKLRVFFASLSNIILPKFSNIPLQELKKSVGRKVLIAFGGMFVGTAILILFIPAIFHFIFPEYTDAIPYAQGFALTLIFIPGILFSQALTAHVKKRELYITNISSDVLKIISLLIFLPLFGLWGGVYALILYYAYKFALEVFYFYRS